MSAYGRPPRKRGTTDDTETTMNDTVEDAGTEADEGVLLTLRALTGWYSPDVKPVRAGVYERQIGSLYRRTFSYFDGKLWHGCWASITMAERNRDYRDPRRQDALPWRGLAGDEYDANQQILMDLFDPVYMPVGVVLDTGLAPEPDGEESDEDDGDDDNDDNNGEQ